MSTSKKTVALFLSILLLFGLTTSQTLAANTQARLLPDVQHLDVGELTTVSLRVEDVQDLYGYQVTITFDPAVLEVIDSDPGATGIQVGLGTFVTPDYVPQNSADNSAGTINCVVSQVAPSTSANGSGTLLTISFRGKAYGTSDVQMSPLVLASAQGTAISAVIHNAQISVGSPTATPTTAPPTATATATLPAPTATPTPTSTVTTPTATPTQGPPTATPTQTPTPPPAGTTITYVVLTGDTLYSIALRYGVTVQILLSINGIPNPNLIFVGQIIIIPVPGGTTPTPPTPTPIPNPTIYVVQRGDTLIGLARRFGTTVYAIAQANHIVNPNLIYVGQRLVIPVHGAPPPPCTGIHVVRYGETLTSIAYRYNTTVWTLTRLNYLPNPNLIYAGQRLTVPC